MWASDGLPRRTRAFMSATIARALACPTSEAELVASLVEDGVDRDTVEGALRHLDAPGLSETERVLVRFARETVWYEPAPLQRRAHELRRAAERARVRRDDRHRIARQHALPPPPRAGARMSASEILLAAVSAVAVLASTTAWWTWRETRRLRERMERASKELEQLQQSLRRFAPGEVIEALIQGVPSAPERREVTVLVADLVGFTALSERLDPAVLVRVLNGYLDRMSRTITEHRGHVSKFLGDGDLGAVRRADAEPWHADDAVRAALAMRSRWHATTGSSRRTACRRSRSASASSAAR